MARRLRASALETSTRAARIFSVSGNFREGELDFFSVGKVCETDCQEVNFSCILDCGDDATCVSNCNREFVTCQNSCPCFEKCYQGCPCAENDYCENRCSYLYSSDPVEFLKQWNNECAQGPAPSDLIFSRACFDIILFWSLNKSTTRSLKYHGRTTLT